MVWLYHILVVRKQKIGANNINTKERRNKMTKYNTYQEAKINNPDTEIVTTGHKWNGREDLIGSFEPSECSVVESHLISDYAWVICNPANYCMTLADFFEAGHKLVGGDLTVNLSGRVSVVGITDSVDSFNEPDHDIDITLFVLSAKALEEKEQVRTKESTAIKTLEVFGYKYKGGEFWEPPVKQIEEKVQVEWKNGDECLVELYDDEELKRARYICFDEFVGMHVCALNLAIYHVSDEELSKPETPEQKKEREEKEAFIKKAREVISGTTETNAAIEKMFEAGMRFK